MEGHVTGDYGTEDRGRGFAGGPAWTPVTWNLAGCMKAGCGIRFLLERFKEGFLKEVGLERGPGDSRHSKPRAGQSTATSWLPALL